jgi:5-methylcytosine-specific restriction endonuclease McrA
MEEIYAFDASRFRLGKLCPKEHDWNGSGCSLRYIAGSCVECQKANSRKQSNTGYHASWARKNRAIHGRPEREELRRQGLTTRGTAPTWHTGARSREEIALIGAIRRAGRRPTVAGLVAQEQRRYWDENPEARLLVEREQKRRHAAWKHKHDPVYRLYHRQKSKRRKAMMRDSVAVQVEAKQLRARFAQFDHCCAYCGVSGEDLHIEHVVPISKGGPHALGNIIPACQRCNFSKRDHDAESWYRRQEFYSEVRWRKICRVLGWSKSAVGQLALL